VLLRILEFLLTQVRAQALLAGGIDQGLKLVVIHLLKKRNGIVDVAIAEAVDAAAELSGKKQDHKQQNNKAGDDSGHHLILWRSFARMRVYCLTSSSNCRRSIPASQSSSGSGRIKTASHNSTESMYATGGAYLAKIPNFVPNSERSQ